MRTTFSSSTWDYGTFHLSSCPGAEACENSHASLMGRLLLLMMMMNIIQLLHILLPL